MNCSYGVSNVPSSAVAHDNIILETSPAVADGEDTDNIKTSTGYAFAKHGANGQDNTYWTVTSGPQASSFAGLVIGVDPKIPDSP